MIQLPVAGVTTIVGIIVWMSTSSIAAENAQRVQANCIVEIECISEKTYQNAFMDVQVDAVITGPDQTQVRVPAFWAGDNRWCFRYAASNPGIYSWKTECSETSNSGLHRQVGKLEVIPYQGNNLLYRHGPVRVAKDQRHFEQSDGTPFFWLGDTWWKCLCKRMTWEGFQRLTADRKAKGFTVVQIVCGVYPDEGPFEARWENEGGKPYLAKDFSVVNPTYFEFADRRLRHLVDNGIVPAIVGSWGRADCDGLAMAGVAGMKRHWRNLVARYGAYPVIWIIGGESGGPQWTEVAQYVRTIDPYHHLVTIHPFDSARKRVTDEGAIDFDMLQTGHGGWRAARGAIPKFKAAYARKPPMPVMIGEYCYEGHMQEGYQDVQRFVFWASTLSGSAGLTYGAAGVWHASVDGDPGLARVYDWTTWKAGINYPGSTQLGLAKKLLEKYPWWRFEPHPEWTEPDCFAAGIPGHVRFIYQPKRDIYDWNGSVVKHIEPNVPYRVFYFDPVTGNKFDCTAFVRADSDSPLMTGHTQPLLFSDSFDKSEGSTWKDFGTPTRRQHGRLIGGKGMLTVRETISETDLMASVTANSDAEAGIVLRFQDPDNYVVALYSPLLKSIFIHDRRNGNWGARLGEVRVPRVGPRIQLVAAATGGHVGLVLTDGKSTFLTQAVPVDNLAGGKTGLWLYQIGDRQEYDEFKLSRTRFETVQRGPGGRLYPLLWADEYHAPPLPSPQDWVLVLERVK